MSGVDEIPFLDDNDITRQRPVCLPVLADSTLRSALVVCEKANNSWLAMDAEPRYDPTRIPQSWYLSWV